MREPGDWNKGESCILHFIFIKEQFIILHTISQQTVLTVGQFVDALKTSIVNGLALRINYSNRGRDGHSAEILPKHDLVWESRKKKDCFSHVKGRSVKGNVSEMKQSGSMWRALESYARSNLHHCTLIPQEIRSSRTRATIPKALYPQQNELNRAHKNDRNPKK